MKRIFAFIIVSFYLALAVAAPAWFPEGLQTKGSSTIGEKSTANSSAVLDIRSTTKGMLPPRMTTAQRTAIATPATGLLVYDTNTLTVWQYNGSGWVEVGSGGAAGALYNVIDNYGFESSIAYDNGWTASGGTLAAATGTNILFDDASATWDASAASQTLSFTSQAVGQGYKGNNCEGAIFVQTPSGTATHKVQVWDGTNVLGSVDVVTTGTTPKEFSTGEFPCPTSGNWQLRILSVASNEPLIAVDNAYLGLSRNVGIGDMDTEWVSYNPLWTSNGTSPSLGNGSLTGRYRLIGDTAEVEINLTLGSTSTVGTLTQWLSLPSELTRDTTKVTSSNFNGGVCYFYDNASSANARAGTPQWTTSPQRVSCYWSGYGNWDQLLTGYGGTGDQVVLTIRYPVTGRTSSAVVRPQSQGWWAGATIGSVTPISLGTTSVAKNEIDQNDITLSQMTGSAPVGVVCASGTASAIGNTTCNTAGVNEVVGITTNVPTSGAYEVCLSAQGLIQDAGAATNASLFNQIILDYTSASSSTAIQSGSAQASNGLQTNSGGGGEVLWNIYPLRLCDIFQVTAGQATFRANVIVTASGTVTANNFQPNTGQTYITVRPVSQQQQAILANSVTTANNNGDRIHRSFINCDGSSAVTSSNESSTSVGNISAGTCTVTFPAYSSAPQCTASIQNCAAPSGSGCFERFSSATTTTTASVKCQSDAGSDCTSSDFYLICIGPR